MPSDTDDKRIAVSERNWGRLNMRKQPGESFDDVIERLVDEHGDAVAPEWAVADDGIESDD